MYLAVKSNVMRINIKQAIKLFFANPSFDMVFTEAVANSLDAGASKIDIKISIEELAKYGHENEAYNSVKNV